ncbi:MAG: nitroreductase [Desulfuromonas sp.]|nr:MAG: nitroreductase [Desulfuromonas sp.]
MLQFTIDQDRCIACGLCAGDCPVKIISMASGIPEIVAGREQNCIGCQHCLAICPTAALSILGHDPDQSVVLEGNLPTPAALETLIRGRRSVRQYRDENLAPELVQQLLDVSWQAPTGVNRRSVTFHVIDDKEVMAAFRTETYAGLAERSETGRLVANYADFAKFAALWHEKGIDVLFRGAPHLLVATAPRSCPTPQEDCLIACSFFDLYARSLGVGTVWNGFIKWAITDILPELKVSLDIPSDHLVGYVLCFGAPLVSYKRTVDHGPARVRRVEGID